MKKYVNLFVFVFMIGACLSQGRAQTKSAVSYKNPVVDIAMPAPTVERFGGKDVLQHCIYE